MIKIIVNKIFGVEVPPRLDALSILGGTSVSKMVSGVLWHKDLLWMNILHEYFTLLFPTSTIQQKKINSITYKYEEL